MNRTGTVLVTGYSGFIGHRLARRLSTIPGIRLVLLGRRGPPATYEYSAHVAADLSTLDPTIWKDHGIDSIHYVLHFGAFTPKSPSDADDEGAVFDSNIVGTRRLLESLPNRPKVVVFASTLDVYGASQDVLSERSPINPTGLYAASKLFCEQYVRLYCSRAASRHVILRFGNIYGPGEEQYKKFIPNNIRLLLSGGTPTINGDGTAARDYFYVDDAVEATVRALFDVETSIDALNITRGESYALKDILGSLCRITGVNKTPDFVPRQQPHSLYTDNTAMRVTLGEWPFKNFEEGLADEVRHVKGN